MSLKDEGKILFEGVGNTFAEEVALEIDEDIENVEITIQYLLSKNLMQASDYEGFMNDVPSLIGSETDSARRVRKHRNTKENRQKMLQSNGEELQSDSDETKGNTEIEIELETELDLELEQNIDDQSEYDNQTVSFEKFWKLYPNKKSKQKAANIFKEVIDEKKATFREIMDGVKNYALEVEQKDTPKKYIKHPTTWLNQGCWTDDYDLEVPEAIDEDFPF